VGEEILRISEAHDFLLLTVGSVLPRYDSLFSRIPLTLIFGVLYGVSTHPKSFKTGLLAPDLHYNIFLFICQGSVC
jgi:hypothetical protein